MTDLKQPTDGYTTSTHGWDTVFAIPAGDVNKAIVDKKSSPLNFSYDDGTVKITSDFGDWQITQGGDGKNIRLQIPMRNIKLTVDSTKKVIDIQTATAITEIELEYLPHTDADLADTNGQPMALKPKLKSDVPTAPVFDVIELMVPDSEKVDIVVKAMVQQVLQEWGNANLSEFNHVFSVVNLNRMVDKGWEFVTPTYTSYAYLDNGGSVDTSLFGVLCMTGGRGGSKNNAQVAFNAIPKGSVAGFLISQARTLHDLVRPAIMQTYSGLTDENFLMDDGQQSLYLKDGIFIDLKPVDHNGSTYYPKLTQLTVKSNGSLFTLNSVTNTEVAAGITATCTTTHYYTLELSSSNKGQTLGFKSYQNPVIVHSIHQSKGSHTTQLIIEIVAAIALIILGILTDGAALIVGGLVIGLLLGADQIVPALIEKVNKDDSPALDLLQVNSVDPITWPDSKDFKLTYGMLNMSLQLGGNPQFI